MRGNGESFQSMRKLHEYAVKRDEMLMKRSVDELRKFTEENAGVLDPVIAKAMLKADDKVLEVTLHKMIVHCTNLPDDFRQESADWLIDHGFSLGIGQGGC